MGLCALGQECDAQQSFMAWATAGIYHEALRLAKRNRRRALRELLILDAPVQDEHNEGGSYRAIDNVAGPDDTEAQALSRLAVEEALDMLTPAQRRIVLGTVIQDLPGRSVARALGISQQTVDRIKWTALRKIGPYLAKGASTDDRPL